MTELNDKFIKAMHAAGLRVTPARQQILAVLETAGEPLSVDQIISQVSGAHFSSIYRSLEAMTQVGITKSIPFGRAKRYALGDTLRGHQHYVVCDSCAAAKPITSDAIERLVLDIAAESNIFHTGHDFTIKGICASCYGPKG